jgi:protein-tyrosine phosphatase
MATAAKCVIGMKRVLFLCSSNRYRSRFAEHLFNWLAESNGLKYRADSRGLAVGQWLHRGPISTRTVAGLKARGIPIRGQNRLPRQVSEGDLASADLIVAVTEAEHRPVLADLFPCWVDRVEYWQIDDRDRDEPEQVLQRLESAVRALAARLRHGGPTIHVALASTEIST